VVAERTFGLGESHTSRRTVTVHEQRCEQTARHDADLGEDVRKLLTAGPDASMLSPHIRAFLVTHEEP
jgi:hypothetical protein